MVWLWWLSAESALD